MRTTKRFAPMMWRYAMRCRLSLMNASGSVIEGCTSSPDQQLRDGQVEQPGAAHREGQRIRVQLAEGQHQGDLRQRLRACTWPIA